MVDGDVLACRVRYGRGSVHVWVEAIALAGYIQARNHPPPLARAALFKKAFVEAIALAGFSRDEYPFHPPL